MVHLGPDDLELSIALHIDLRAGVEGDLHLVQALLVAGLGLAHATTAGGRTRGHAGAAERDAGDRGVAGARGVYDMARAPGPA